MAEDLLWLSQPGVPTQTRPQTLSLARETQHACSPGNPQQVEGILRLVLLGMPGVSLLYRP